MSALILDVTTWLDARGDAHAIVLTAPGTPEQTAQQTAQRAIKRRLRATGDADATYTPRTREYPWSDTAEGREYVAKFAASDDPRPAIARAYRERI